MRYDKLFVSLVVALVSQAAGAVDHCVAYVPPDCQIQGSRFDAHEKSTVMSLEVDCVSPDGRYTKYIATRSSIAAIFAASRNFMPSRVDFEKGGPGRVQLSCT